MSVTKRLALVLVLAATACDRRPIAVGGPFYLTFVEDPNEVALFRCPDGPDGGCAIDDLPGPRVIAAGANKGFVVVAQQPDEAPNGPVRFYYFGRVPQERSGWGRNPEHLVGPLDARQFAAAKAQLRLPDFTVRP